MKYYYRPYEKIKAQWSHENTTQKSWNVLPYLSFLLLIFLKKDD